MYCVFLIAFLQCVDLLQIFRVRRVDERADSRHDVACADLFLRDAKLLLEEWVGDREIGPAEINRMP